MYHELDRLNRSRTVRVLSHAAGQTLPVLNIHESAYSYYEYRARRLRSQLFWALVRAAQRRIAALGKARRQRRLYRELRQIDEHLLKDIGLSRDTLYDAVYGTPNVQRAARVTDAPRSSQTPPRLGTTAANDTTAGRDTAAA